MLSWDCPIVQPFTIGLPTIVVGNRHLNIKHLVNERFAQPTFLKKVTMVLIRVMPALI